MNQRLRYVCLPRFKYKVCPLAIMKFLFALLGKKKKKKSVFLLPSEIPGNTVML